MNMIEAASTKRLIPTLLIFSVFSLRGFMLLALKKGEDRSV